MFGTPTHNPHTIGSMYHTPKGPTGPIYPGNGGKENAVNYTGGGYYASVPPVDALSMGIGGLNIGRPSSSAYRNSRASTFRGGNDDLSSIGASPTVDPLNPRQKKTKDNLVSGACLFPDHRLLLESQTSQQLLDATRNSVDVCKERLLWVSTLAVDNDPPNPLLPYKQECMKEESIYKKEEERAKSEIKEIEGAIKTGQENLEEQKTLLRGESEAQKMQVNIEYDDKTAKLQREIAELQSRLEGLPKEREAAKKRLDTECGNKIANLQSSHEEQERDLNRKLKRYKKAERELREEKVNNLAFPMAQVHAIELTLKILKKHLVWYQRASPKLENDIKLMEGKLQRLLNAIAENEYGTCYDEVWSYPHVDDTD